MSGSDLFRRTLVFWALLLFGSAGSMAAVGSLQTQPGHFPGLLAPVRIVWDHDRMPHVFASNDHDAYFAMGYLHARDRLFQMDYSRRLFSGTLAELIGNTALASDIQLRTLGLRRAAERSWEVYTAEAKTLFDAYASGVNAFIQRGRRGSSGRVPKPGIDGCGAVDVHRFRYGRHRGGFRALLRSAGHRAHPGP